MKIKKHFSSAFRVLFECFSGAFRVLFEFAPPLLSNKFAFCFCILVDWVEQASEPSGDVFSSYILIYVVGCFLFVYRIDIGIDIGIVNGIGWSRETYPSTHLNLPPLSCLSLWPLYLSSRPIQGFSCRNPLLRSIPQSHFTALLFGQDPV